MMRGSRVKLLVASCVGGHGMEERFLASRVRDVIRTREELAALALATPHAEQVPPDEDVDDDDDELDEDEDLDEDDDDFDDDDEEEDDEE